MSVGAPRIVMVTFPVTKFMTNTTKGTFIGAHSLRQRKPAWGVGGMSVQAMQLQHSVPGEALRLGPELEPGSRE